MYNALIAFMLNNGGFLSAEMVIKYTVFFAHKKLVLLQSELVFFMAQIISKQFLSHCTPICLITIACITDFCFKRGTKLKIFH